MAADAGEIALNCRRRRLVGGFSCPEAECFSGRREWRETMEGSKATVVLDGNGVVRSSSGSEAMPKAVCSRQRKSDMVERSRGGEDWRLGTVGISYQSNVNENKKAHRQSN